MSDTLDDLAASWTIDLRAEGKSKHTIISYTASLRAYARWCGEAGVPAEISRQGVASWLAALRDNGAESSTVSTRYRALRLFAAWCVREDVLDSDPIASLRPPKLDSKIVPKISDAELVALIAACSGKSFVDRRDEAVVRLMAETMGRADEVVSMSLDDIDVKRGIATIRRGKGGRGRIAPFGPQTARALDRYLRARRQHPCAGRPDLWLSISRRNDGAWGYAGLYRTLCRRAGKAGIPDFHPHKLRHTGASRWLTAGGSEGGLMAIAGWRTRSMIERYTSDTAAERAADESRGLDLGNI
jgi:integrase/recombinase XerD